MSQTLKRGFENVAAEAYHQVVVWITFNMPITQQDVTHVEQNTRYAVCEIPKVHNVRITPIPNNNRQIRIEWNIRDGCVSAIEIAELKVNVRTGITPVNAVSISTQGVYRDENRGVFYSTLPIAGFWRSMDIISIEARPSSRIRGSVFYPARLGLVPNRITLR